LVNPVDGGGEGLGVLGDNVRRELHAVPPLLLHGRALPACLSEDQKLRRQPVDDPVFAGLVDTLLAELRHADDRTEETFVKLHARGVPTFAFQVALAKLRARRADEFSPLIENDAGWLVSEAKRIAREAKTAREGRSA
jgi:hypothetical protein